MSKKDTKDRIMTDKIGAVPKLSIRKYDQSYNEQIKYIGIYRFETNKIVSGFTFKSK